MNYLRKNLEHFFNILRYLLERLLCIIVILFIIVIATFFFFRHSQIVTPSSFESQEILFCGISLENLSSWFGGIAIIIAAFWSMYQFVKSRTIRQQERASEIAKSFSDDLTIKCAIIYAVIEHSELYSLLELDKKNYDSFKVFNTNEIRSVYCDDNFIEKYEKTFDDSDLDQIYYRLLDTRISFNKFKDLTLQNKYYTVEDAKKLFELNNSIFPFHFKYLISDVLNELEYLCMNLSSQAAGSKYVYQSLHQNFLRTIRLLCVHISLSNNKTYSDKFYTNIIYVYNEWTNLYMQDLKREKKRKEKINKILNPKIKTV